MAEYATKADIEEIIGQAFETIFNPAMQMIADRFDQMDRHFDRLETTIERHSVTPDRHELRLGQHDAALTKLTTSAIMKK